MIASVKATVRLPWCGVVAAVRTTALTTSCLQAAYMFHLGILKVVQSVVRIKQTV